MTDTLHWFEADEERSALWRSEGGARVPKKMVIADDTIKADNAYHLAAEGTALLWRGDFQNARLLLQAMARRVDKRPAKAASASTGDAFNLHRQAQSQRARILGMLLVPLEADFSIPLRRAPDVALACREVWGEAEGPSVLSLRELLGVIGAHEWRKKGVPIPVLDANIHPHYGVFSPVRGEYLELVAKAPLPISPCPLAMDVGTGTGVLAAILAKKGVARIIATEQSPRALACARDNLERLALTGQVDLREADLFPQERAPLVVCNPPWLPARPASPLEAAIYDPDSRMLKGFLNGLAAHLTQGGEGWLILSDLAEHLGLRSRKELLSWVDEAGLKVLGRREAKPHHPKVSDTTDPLHAARKAEITSLWRLGAK